MPKIALLQMTCSDDAGQNLTKATTLIKEAAKKGAEILCLQELFRSRYFCQVEDELYFKLAETIPGPTTETLSPLARKMGVVLVVSIYEKDPQGLFNSAAAIDADGKILGKYRKVHIPDDLKNHYGEAFYFKKGNLGYPVFETRFAKIGLQVCYDQWFPEGARTLSKAGAEIIFYPTAIGWTHSSFSQICRTGQTGLTGADEHDAWLTVQRGHAISNGVFVAACNRVGTEDHLNFWGSSFVSDPMGKIPAQASSDKEETLVVECDLKRIEEVRRDWPFLKEC